MPTPPAPATSPTMQIEFRAMRPMSGGLSRLRRRSGPCRLPASSAFSCRRCLRRNGAPRQEKNTTPTSAAAPHLAPGAGRAPEFGNACMRARWPCVEHLVRERRTRSSPPGAPHLLLNGGAPLLPRGHVRQKFPFLKHPHVGGVQPPQLATQSGGVENPAAAARLQARGRARWASRFSRSTTCAVQPRQSPPV